MITGEKCNIGYLLLLSILIFISSDNINGQNAPITTAATVANALPGAVTVPVTVTGFTNIGAISLTLEYDYAVTHFAAVAKNSLLAGSFNFADSDMGNGKHRIILSWFGNGVTLTNGSAMFTITFTFISGITTLEWFDNGGSCQYANGSSVVLNDLPTNTYYINGAICGGLENPGPITGTTSVCQGESGIAYSVNPLTNAIAYIWSVPAGATIITGSNTNSITVDFSNNAVSGNVIVNGVSLCGNGPASQLPVTVNALPIANAGNDTTIPHGTWTTLHAASGGSGSFTYHWSPDSLLVNPNVQNPQTVQLTFTTVFTLDVTNQTTLCEDSDEVILTITGGPLNLNPIAVPNGICVDQVVQLYSNVGGGSGNYTYQWTSNPAGTPPWNSTLANPLVYPDVSTQYLVAVTDGYNNVSGSTFVTVNPLPTATISGGDSLCDNGSTTTLAIDLTGTPPWSLIWSDGVNSYTVSGQMTTPYLIETSEPGSYTILSVADVFCTGTTSGSAIVVVSPIPAAPVITQVSDELLSSLCCGNQWYLDGYPVPGATAQSYTPAESGSYFDIVKLNGCSSDTSNIIDLITTIENKITDQPWFYPNPARESVRLRCPGQDCWGTKIQIMNPCGLMVREFFPDKMIIGFERELYIGNLSPGFYLVKIQEEKEIFLTKLVIE